MCVLHGARRASHYLTRRFTPKHATSHWSHTQSRREKVKRGVPCSAIICAKPWEGKRRERREREHLVSILCSIVMKHAFLKRESMTSEHKHLQSFPCSSRRLSKSNPHVSPENFKAGLSLTCSFYLPQLQVLGSLGAKASFEQQSSTLLWKWLKVRKLLKNTSV